MLFTTKTTTTTTTATATSTNTTTPSNNSSHASCPVMRRSNKVSPFLEGLNEKPHHASDGVMVQKMSMTPSTSTCHTKTSKTTKDQQQQQQHPLMNLFHAPPPPQDASSMSSLCCNSRSSRSRSLCDHHHTNDTIRRNNHSKPTCTCRTPGSCTCPTTTTKTWLAPEDPTETEDYEDDDDEDMPPELVDESLELAESPSDDDSTSWLSLTRTVETCSTILSSSSPEFALTTTATNTQRSSPPITSILSPSSKTTFHRQRRPTSKRRIRGLWNDHPTTKTTAETTLTPIRHNNDNVKADDMLEDLRDETLLHVMGYLNLCDLQRMSCVGRRYQSLTRAPVLWKRVDASEFVQTLYKYHYATTTTKSPKQKQQKAQTATGQALEQVLASRGGSMIESLTISNIHQALSADHYLPSLASLQELVLTHMDDLTDTHVHVMLLMTLKSKNTPQQLRPRKSTNLQVLKLEHCPKLTTASVRSIASTCTNLERLSFKGCQGLDQLTPLASLFVIQPKPQLAMAAAAAAAGVTNNKPSTSSMAAFFQPPQQQQPKPSSSRNSNNNNPVAALMMPRAAPKPTNAMASLFSPPPPSATSKPTNAMASLFSPPPPSATSKPTNAMASLFSPPPPSAISKPTNAMASLFSPPPPSATSKPANAMASLFSPPPPPATSKPTNAMASLFSPPPSATTPTVATNNNDESSPSTTTTHSERSASPPKQPTSSLTSLFAPPGMSPPRPTAPLLCNPKLLGRSPSIPLMGQLLHLNVQGTSVTPSAVLDTLQTALKTKDNNNNKSESWIILHGLQVNGETWDDSHLERLSEYLALQELRELDISSSSEKKKGLVTALGLQQLTRAATPKFTRLRTGNFSGHLNITAVSVTSFIRQTPQLEQLTLKDCSPHLEESRDQLELALIKATNKKNNQADKKSQPARLIL